MEGLRTNDQVDCDQGHGWLHRSPTDPGDGRKCALGEAFVYPEELRKAPLDAQQRPR